jgi:hypothetical protein
MKRIALAALPLLLATPSFAADFDGPRYGEREYFERREVVREEPPKVVEHHHYHHNVAPRVHVEERIYREPHAYAYYDKHTATTTPGVLATISGTARGVTTTIVGGSWLQQSSES